MEWTEQQIEEFDIECRKALAKDLWIDSLLTNDCSDEILEFYHSYVSRNSMAHESYVISNVYKEFSSITI